MQSLDLRSLEIFRAVAIEGSVSKAALKLNRVQSNISTRVKQLEHSGVISRRVALMDQDLLGLSLTVYIQVSLGNQVPGMLEHFEQRIVGYPEVLECSLVTGSDADYLLKAVIPDMSHYEKFLLRELNQIDGVSHIRTSFVLRRVVARTELPLGHISG